MFARYRHAAFALSIVLTSVVTACGGGGGGEPAAATPPATGSDPVSTPSQPAAPQLASNSYTNAKGLGLGPQTLPGGDNTMRAWGDFAGNGRLDLFRAWLTYDHRKPEAEATPSRFEFWSRQADGSLSLESRLLPDGADGCIHPRKPIVADFNGDGRPDVFVACHGYDSMPFPGEKNKVVLSQPNGTYVISNAAPDVGFHHGASAADLNGDGHIDVVVTNNNEERQVYTLLNDGTGHFSRETVRRTPTAIQWGNLYTVELVDVDEDGKLDLVVGGHEWEGGTPRVYLNPGNNDFSAVAPVVLPAVPGDGVVLDFLLTGSGATRAIWMTRTSGGDGTFYESKVVQKVTWPSLNSSVPLKERPGRWVPWLVPAVVNGTPVVTSDNAIENFSLPQ